MTKTELLKDLMRFQVSRYNYRIVGHSLYFILPNNNFAVAKLLNTNKPNDYNGISITCVNVPFGEINSCELLFSDIFYDENTTTIVRRDDGSFEWYKQPSVLDKLNLSDHIGKYFEIISYIDRTSMFASSGMPFLGLGAAALSSVSSDKVIEYQKSYLPDNERAIEANIETERYEPIGLSTYEEPKENDDIHDTSDCNENVVTEQENRFMEEVITQDPFIEEEVGIDDISEKTEPLITTDIPATVITTEMEKEAEDKPPTIKEEVPEVKAESEPESIFKSDSELIKKKSLFSGWFKKKEPSEIKAQTSTSFEKSAFTEMKDAVGDSEIPQEKIFMSWDVQKDEDSDVKAALKKTQDDEYELRIFGKGDMMNLKLIPWEAYAFNIHKVIVYEGVTSIGDNAFRALKFMDSVDISDSVKRIGASAFEYCEGLTEITLPKQLEEIGEFAFSGCDGIRKFILPDSISVIGDYAFDFDRLAGLTVYCSNPDNISIGTGIDPTRFLVKKSSI